MKPIAIFHHSRISGGEPAINFDWATGILVEQISAMCDSGLAKAASEIFFGVNGGEADAAVVASMVPKKAQVITHPDGARGELPTLNKMWRWARSHPGWIVCYLHTKAATHTGNAMYRAWMRCMLRGVVHNWQQCANDLERGFEAVGCHWLTAEKYSNVGPPFFGGNFFWTTSEFLMTLPEIPSNATDWGMRYLAEVFISSGPRVPRVRDYHNAWPGAKCHQIMGD